MYHSRTSSGCSSHGRLERADDHALLGELGGDLDVDRGGAALDDEGAHLVVAEGVGQGGGRDVGGS